MSQPTALDLIVGRAVDWTRIVHLLLGSVGGVVCLILAPLWVTPLWVIGVVISYHVSLRLIGKVLAYTLPRQALLEDLQLRRINELNRRIAEGLEPGEEMDKLVEEAGLEPLHIPVAYGPVFGKYKDAELFEWIDAKRGMTGETHRYVYEGIAEVDENNYLIIPNDEKQYMSLDGILYSRT